MEKFGDEVVAEFMEKELKDLAMNEFRLYITKQLQEFFLKLMII